MTKKPRRRPADQPPEANPNQWLLDLADSLADDDWRPGPRSIPMRRGTAALLTCTATPSTVSPSGNVDQEPLTLVP